MSEAVFSLKIGHASHVGKVREVNEDSYLILTPPTIDTGAEALFLVADGVGGANAGEVASGILTESFWRWFTDGSYRQVVHYNAAHADYFVAALKDLLEAVNERLYELAHTHKGLANMGTTATVGVLNRGRLFLGHVGDTRAYLWRQDGGIRRLTADHSWVADQVAAGRLTEAEAQNHPKRNLVNRVLGAGPILRVDRDFLSLQVGDRLIFASDGLTGLVTDDEIQQIILASNHPQQACDELVNWANHRGGADNITVLVVELVAGGISDNGSIPGGVAVSSVYLGHGVDQRTNSSVSQPVNERAAAPALARRQRAQRANRLKPIMLLGFLSVALGLLSAVGALFVLTIEQNFGLPFENWQLSGIIAIVALWIGYFAGRLTCPSRSGR